MRQVDGGRLQRQRDIDRRTALVDGEADIDTRRDTGAEAADPAPGLAAVTDEIADRAVPGRQPIAFEPGAIARRFRRLEAFRRRRDWYVACG